MSSELMALRHGDSAVRFLATQLSHLPFRLLLAPIGQGTPVVDPDLVYDALLGSSVHFSFFQSVPVTLSLVNQLWPLVSGNPNATNGPLSVLAACYSTEKQFASMWLKLDGAVLGNAPSAEWLLQDEVALEEDVAPLYQRGTLVAQAYLTWEEDGAAFNSFVDEAEQRWTFPADVPGARTNPVATITAATLAGVPQGIADQWDGLFGLVALATAGANQVYPPFVRADRDNFDRWVELGVALELVALIVSSGVFVQLDRHRQRLEHDARHDGLTGLPNRVAALANLERALAQAARGADITAVLYIDLDRFKQANDVYGHPAGDQVLREVGERLSKTVRAGDVVARLGGDEFVVTAEHVDGPDEMRGLGERLIAVISQPIDWRGAPINIGASIGVAITEGDEVDAETLLALADREMFTTKREGGGVAVYDYRPVSSVVSSA
jgi:diguanylate cyclase (GGDEF)-like protein